jgi:beta-phosphoglucomutase-like phosphatase (HAD superfamily)
MMQRSTSGRLPATIFDVDGVLLSSPHERAWREALDGFADPARFTTAFYQAHVAGKPRLDGARAALEQLGVKDAKGRATAYAEAKQKRLEALMREGCVTTFPDAVRFVQAMEAIDGQMAVASASKNANQMMQPICLNDGQPLLEAFSVNICGRDFRHGKPDPEIYLTAAAELGAPPSHCLVIEDAPVGIEAAHAGGMTALGIDRVGDGDLLWKAGADLVVASLDEIALEALSEGRLCRRSS